MIKMRLGSEPSGARGRMHAVPPAGAPKRAQPRRPNCTHSSAPAMLRIKKRYTLARSGGPYGDTAPVIPTHVTRAIASARTRTGSGDADLGNLKINQERESSDNPMLNAFCRVAPSDRLSFLAIVPAGVFLRAIDFNSRTSPAVHARRFFDLLAINPPFQERLLVSLTGAKEKSGDQTVIMLLQSNHRPKVLHACKLRSAFVRYLLARCELGRKSNLRGASLFFDCSHRI